MDTARGSHAPHVLPSASDVLSEGRKALKNHANFAPQTKKEFYIPNIDAASEVLDWTPVPSPIF